MSLIGEPASLLSRANVVTRRVLSGDFNASVMAKQHVDRFVRLELFRKHPKKLRQTTKLVAAIDLKINLSDKVIMYVCMETIYDRKTDLHAALDVSRETGRIESGRLWLSSEEFLQLASLMIHCEEFFRTSYEKDTPESEAKMKSFRKAWKTLKKETWG